MKQLKIRTILLSLSTAMLFGITGCSSGGSTGNDNTDKGAVDTILSGVGIDGYLSQATVCLDLNLDGYCQVGDEPASYTDESGKFSLTLTTAQKLAYPEYAKAPLLIYSGYDVDTGVDFTGKLKADLGAGQGINVSPISTIVKSIMDNNKTKEQADTFVKKMLDLPDDVDLGADPVKVAKTNPKLLKAALKLHKTVEVLAAAKKQAGSAQNANELTNELYKKLAEQAAQNKKLADAVTQVVTEDSELDADAKESATAISGQIDFIVGDAGITDTAVIGTKIGAVKQELVVAIENNESVPTIQELKTVADTSFSLLHAKEILRIVNMEDKDTSENGVTKTLSTDIKTVLKAGGMTEKEFLPVDKEIELLKSDKRTFLVGANFEDFRNAGLEAKRKQLEAEAKAAAEKKALQDQIDKLNADIAKADAEEKAKLEAEKLAKEQEAAAAEAKADADAEAAAAKAEADRLARLKAKVDAAVQDNLLDSSEADKLAAELEAAKEAEAKQLAAAINSVSNEIATILQTATTAKNTATTQVEQVKRDAEYAQKIADEYPAATQAATTANNAYVSAKSSLDSIQVEYGKIQTAATAVGTATTLESANQELTKAKEAFNATTTHLETVDSNVTVTKTALTLAKSFVTSTNIDVAALKSSVKTLYSDTTAKDGATVSDAKNMFNQLRETAVTFSDMDNPEANSSTIIGGQIDTLKTKIKPALESIGEDFNQSAIGMQDAVEAFGTSIEADFNTTIQTVQTRVENLTKQTENFSEDQNWSVTAGTDTLSRTVSRDNSVEPVIQTEVITLNGQSITLQSKIDSNNDTKPVSLSTNGALALKGENYDLEVTSLSFVNKKVTLKVNGEISGDNSATMTLTNLDVVLDFDTNIDGMNAISNIALTLDGTIFSSGRTLKGKLVLNENSPSILDGAFTGLSDEPSFVGKVTLNTSLNALLSDFAINDSEISLWNPLVMAHFADGTQSFVTSWSDEYISSSSNENSSTYSSKYTLNTQSGDSVVCDVSDNNYDKQYTPDGNYYYRSHDHNISCENDVTLTSYSPDNEKLTAEFNGKERVISDVWSWSNYSNGITTYNMNFYVKSEGDTYVDESGTMYLNGEEVTVSNIKITPHVNLLDRTFDFKFDGNITDGSKKIVATLGANRGVESEIYAQNVLITDGTSSITLDELNVVLPNAEFLNLSDDSNSNNSYSSNHNQFVNYSERDEMNYDNDENSLPKEMNVKVTGLKASIVDTDAKALTINADAMYDTNSSKVNVLFDGTYEYAGTKFVGHIDANGTNHEVTKIEDDGETNTDNEILGTANVYGSIESYGFIPFTITATLTTEADENFVGYAKFTRNNSYELGVYVHQANNSDAGTKTTSVDLGDNNGVLGSLTRSEVPNTDTATPTLNITNKSGTSLATYGEDINGNEWEIVYSDNTSETLF